MPRPPDDSSERRVTLAVTKYWDGDACVDRALHYPSSDEQVSLASLVARMVDELDPADGEAVVVLVQRTPGTTANFGLKAELRMRKTEDGSFVREVEDEVGDAELLLRRASRRAGRRDDQPFVVDTSVRLPGDAPAGWDRRLAVLWEEDEVLRRDPDAMHLRGAVEGLCGCSFAELGPALAKVDYGDGGYDLHRDGWVTGWSCCGDSVCRLVTEEVKP